jgi:APA family basic amino acid/polyamine antiporter
VILGLWVVGGLVALAGGLIWAELGSRLPVSGGNYVYLQRTYGRHLAFLYGWKAMVITSPANRAALAIVAADYAGSLVSLSKEQHLWFALGTLGTLGAMNYVGVRLTANFQDITAALKVVGLSILVILGLRTVIASPGLLSATATPTSDVSPAVGVAIAGMLIFFTYTGWARLGNVAEELRDPQRTLPRTVLLGLPLIIVLYLLLNIVYFGVLGVAGVRASDVVVSDVASTLIGASGAVMISLLILVSVTGSMSVSIMTHSRLFYAMARNGAFFRFLDYVHPRFRTPSRAVALHIGIAMIYLILKRNFTDLVTSAIFLNIIFYILRASSIFRLRARGIGDEGRYRMPFYPVLPILFICALGALFGIRLVLDWQRAWFDLALLALGLPASYAWHRFVKP